MSESFYTNVSRLFTLMDMDNDHYVDRDEAYYSLAACYESVHARGGDVGAAAQRVDADPFEKQRTIQKQVVSND